MDTNGTRTGEKQVQLYDENGRLIGVVTRPVLPDAIGPGREKVYLARRDEADRTPHAA